MEGYFPAIGGREIASIQHRTANAGTAAIDIDDAASGVGEDRPIVAEAGQRTVGRQRFDLNGDIARTDLVQCRILANIQLNRRCRMRGDADHVVAAGGPDLEDRTVEIGIVVEFDLRLGPGQFDMSGAGKVEARHGQSISDIQQVVGPGQGDRAGEADPVEHALPIDDAAIVDHRAAHDRVGKRVQRGGREAQAQREATQAQAGADARPELKPMLEALARGDIGGAKRALVLLAHQPKTFTDASKLGVDLQLSGHTHGGQIFPWSYLVRLQQPFVAGLHKLHGTWIYVSRGTGYWGPPMRLGAPAEITLIELVRAA